MKIFKNTYKSMAGAWDYGFRFECCGDAAKLFVYDDDSEWGVFIRFLVCPDISVVYITDVYGTGYNGDASWDEDPYTLIDDLTKIPNIFWEVVFPRVFRDEGYKVLPFLQAEFDSRRDEICRRAYERANVLSMTVLPLCIIREIIFTEIPEWVKYKHVKVGDVLPALTKHEDYIFEHFMFMPYSNEETVTLEIAA